MVMKIDRCEVVVSGRLVHHHVGETHFPKVRDKRFFLKCGSIYSEM